MNFGKFFCKASARHWPPLRKSPIRGRNRLRRRRRRRHSHSHRPGTSCRGSSGSREVESLRFRIDSIRSISRCRRPMMSQPNGQLSNAGQPASPFAKRFQVSVVEALALPPPPPRRCRRPTVHDKLGQPSG
jgi:hypothetical protein